VSVVDCVGHEQEPASPGGPRSPVAPRSPCGPRNPCGPISPDGPTGPCVITRKLRYFASYLYGTLQWRWLWAVRITTRCPLFFNIDFPWLFHDQKMKIHDLSAQHIFSSKRYTTYECISELVVTVPSARSTIVKKIKRFIIWLYKWSRVILQNCSVQ